MKKITKKVLVSSFLLYLNNHTIDYLCWYSKEGVARPIFILNPLIAYALIELLKLILFLFSF